MPICTLRKRSEFLAVRGGARFSSQGFLIEAKRRGDAASASETSPIPSRFGFTVTKKLGKAVSRNRIRRRLKAAIQSLAADFAQPGFDYVIVARGPALTLPYETLKQDFVRAFGHIHKLQRKTAKGGP